MISATTNSTVHQITDGWSEIKDDIQQYLIANSRIEHLNTYEVRNLFGVFRQHIHSLLNRYLWTKGVLVQIQGGVWSMETKLTADDLNLISGGVPEFATLGKKKLLDSKHKNDFLSVISKARTSAERFGFPFVLTGSYFVPFSNMAKLKDVIEGQKKIFHEKVDRFVDSYTKLREDYLDRYPESRSVLESCYPEPESLRSKFIMDVVYYTADVTGTMADTDDSDDMYWKWAVESMNSLRSEARETAYVIREAIENGVLDGRIIRRVQTLNDRIQTMDIFEDSALLNAALSLRFDTTIRNTYDLENAAGDVNEFWVLAALIEHDKQQNNQTYQLER